MNDLSRIVDEMCAWFDKAETASLSISAETVSTLKNRQHIEIASNFHSSHSFHVENEPLGLNDLIEVGTSCFSAGGSRVTSSCDGSVETAESVERGSGTPAASTPSPFPLSLDKVERVERAKDGCEPVLSSETHLVPPPGDPLPISPSAVRAGVERELRGLAETGREGPGALRDAVEIVRARIRNAPALVERQFNGSRCHVCNASLFDGGSAIAVLNSGGAALHMHDTCHDAYRARRTALVDRIMAAAGYGAEAKGEAA